MRIWSKWKHCWVTSPKRTPALEDKGGNVDCRRCSLLFFFASSESFSCIELPRGGVLLSESTDLSGVERFSCGVGFSVGECSGHAGFLLRAVQSPLVLNLGEGYPSSFLYRVGNRSEPSQFSFGYLHQQKAYGEPYPKGIQ